MVSKASQKMRFDLKMSNESALEDGSVVGDAEQHLMCKMKLTIHTIHFYLHKTLQRTVFIIQLSLVLFTNWLQIDIIQSALLKAQIPLIES